MQVVAATDTFGSQSAEAAIGAIGQIGVCFVKESTLQYGSAIIVTTHGRGINAGIGPGESVFLIWRCIQV